jgi:hypothetical protein
VVTSLPRIAIDFAREVFGNFARGDAIFHGALVAEIHNAKAAANGRDGESLARLRRRDRERTEIGAIARRPLFARNIHESDDVDTFSSSLRFHNSPRLFFVTKSIDRKNASRRLGLTLSGTYTIIGRPMRKLCA